MGLKKMIHREDGWRCRIVFRRRFHSLLLGVAAVCLCVSGQGFANVLVGPDQESIQTISMYSTSPGHVAFESQEGGSLFSQGLAVALKDGAETVVDAFLAASRHARSGDMPAGRPTLVMDAWRPVTLAPANDGERRIALLVGNSEYRDFNDLTVSRDLAALDDALESLGFDVTLVTDVDAVTLQGELGKLADRVASADTVFLYVGGHGVSMGGVNYFLGIDAHVEDQNVVDKVSIDTLASSAKRAVADYGTLIVVYDASRAEMVSYKIDR